MLKLHQIFNENFQKLATGKTSYEIAKASDGGLTVPTVERMMDGKAPPRLESIDEVAKVLGVNPWDLITPKSVAPKVPADIIKMLEDLPDYVYDSIRGSVAPFVKLKKKR